jgi:histidinol-phosphate aminotransferase
MGYPIRPNVLQMRPYAPGKPIDEVKRELGLERVIKLASNENPLGPSPLAVEALRRAAEHVHLYPDGAQYELRQAVALRFGVAPESVFGGNGSDELIGLLGHIMLGSPEDEVVAAEPSFVRYYAAAHLAPCRLVSVPLDNEFRHDLPAMARACTERTKLIFVANPNNPTGTIVRRAEFEEFLDQVPPQALVVLDEAYFEFAATEADYPRSTDYLDRGVVGLRTMSKSYGLAGLRIGFGFAAPEVVDALDRVRGPFNVNSLAQVAAVAALSDEEHLQSTLRNNREGVAVIDQALKEGGARTCPTFANFVFADLGVPSMPVFEALLRRGVIVRPGEGIGAPGCLRVSIGTPEENAVFAEEFVAVMREY